MGRRSILRLLACVCAVAAFGAPRAMHAAELTNLGGFASG
jgi:hypothetical protein